MTFTVSAIVSMVLFSRPHRDAFSYIQTSFFIVRFFTSFFLATRTMKRVVSYYHVDRMVMVFLLSFDTTLFHRHRPFVRTSLSRCNFQCQGNMLPIGRSIRAILTFFLSDCFYCSERFFDLFLNVIRSVRPFNRSRLLLCARGPGKAGHVFRVPTTYWGRPKLPRSFRTTLNISIGRETNFNLSISSWSNSVSSTSSPISTTAISPPGKSLRGYSFSSSDSNGRSSLSGYVSNGQ